MTAPPRPLPPRPAGTLLLLRDDPLEVLLVRRHARATFASALVFPGGTVDPGDAAAEWLPLLAGAAALTPGERALRIAALRETFEETGLLIVQGGTPRATGRRATGARAFIEAVGASGGSLSLDEVVPFGHWITPTAAAKRYDTHFYLCRAPSDAVAVCDGEETVSLEWAEPQAILARFEAGERSILFPTRMNLKRLAESRDVGSALAAARTRPIVTVEPRMEERPAGRAVLIPAEAGYGVTEDLFPVLN